jgi:hypothetical protein
MREKRAVSKGRLRLYDDTESPILGFWEWNTRPGTTMAALEQSFLTVIDTAPKVSARRSELKATGKYTDAGIVEQLTSAALEQMRPLRRARNIVGRAKAELAERRAQLKLKSPDRTDIVGGMERQEIRSWLRSLSQEERDKIFNGGGERVDPAIAEAVISAPSELCGVAPSNLELMKRRALEAQFPGEAEDLAELEEAIVLVERAVQVNTDEIVKEFGIPKDQVSKLAESVLREVDAADAAEMTALKLKTEKASLDANAVFQHIRDLPFDERKKFIDFAIDKNADQLIGESH